jgi:Domain of unknown function (DUF6985)
MLIPTIQNGLFDHYAPYKDAIEAGERIAGPALQIANAQLVLSHVSSAHILIEPLKDGSRLEIAFKAEWDVEHTVAVIFQDWVLMELNGSVRRH